MPAGHTKRGEQTQHTSNTALRGARPSVTQARFVKKTGAGREREETHSGDYPVVRRWSSRGHAFWVDMLQMCQPTSKTSATCLSPGAGLEYGVEFVCAQLSSDQAETPVQAAASGRAVQSRTTGRVQQSSVSASDIRRAGCIWESQPATGKRR